MARSRLRATAARRPSPVEDAIARCVAAEAEPALRVAPTAVASAFLGSAPIAALALPGKVTGDPAAIVRADRTFGWPVAAWRFKLF
jgi:hypothetical protein